MCLNIYGYTDTYIYVSIYIPYLHINTRKCIYLYIKTYIYKHVYVYVQMCMHTYSCV